MIDRLLERVRGRVEAADALWHRYERTAIAFEAGRLKAAAITEQGGLNLRVMRNGRPGIAGTTAPERLDDLIARALQTAELGEPVALAFPARQPLPSVMTRYDRAATASLDDLIQLGRELLERLRRDGMQVNVNVERAVAEIALGNTAGARGAYPATAVSVSADITRVAGDDVLMVYDFLAGGDLPTAGEIDALVGSITTRLELALRVAPPPEGSLPVVFTPAGLAAILLPVEQALSGKAVLQGISPLGAKVGQTMFDARFSVIDDPLAAGREGTRPVDDEGVPSRVLPLVEAGVVRRFIYDLETAARADTASTGHGQRGTFGKPRVGFTNLIVTGNGTRAAGSGTRDFGGGLLTGIDDGLVIDDLIGVGQGNVIGGAFSHPVALAYRVRHGEIVGRVKDAAVAGNVYELLRRLGGVGTDGRWLGSRWSPSLLLEGVSVARR